jgi:RNA polymerase sigma factor (sigma-70 family)
LTRREKLRAAALRQWADPDARERILAGQRAARLFRENQGLATWAANRYAWSALDFDDLRQAALLGLHRAAAKYDPERGARFSTVAAWYMFSEIGKEIATTRSLVRVPAHRPVKDGPRAISLETPIAEDMPLGSLLPSDDEDAPEVGADRALTRERVEEALGTLRDRDRFVVEHRFGLNGCGGRTMTLDEIGRHLSISRARVGQIEARALGRLRFRLPKT